MTLSGSIRLAALSLVAMVLSAQQYTISTVAGGVLPPTPARAIEISIGVTGPITMDTTGNIYFASFTSVFKLDTRGIVTHVAGIARTGYSGDGGLATVAQFRWIEGLATGLDGSIYIADTNSHRVRRVSPDGIVTTVAGTGFSGRPTDGSRATAAPLSLPFGLAMDVEGNLYISEIGNSQVKRVSPDGIITTVVGDGTAGFSGDGGPAIEARLDGPAGLAIDANGNLYIAERNNSRIRRVSTDGVIVTVAGTGEMGNSGDGGPATRAAIGSGYDVAFDRDGNLHIASNSGIRKVLPDGTITTESPLRATGLAIGATGELYAAGSDGARFFQVLPSGDLSTIAGSGSPTYSGDGGPAVAAQVGVEDVALDREGNLYISDYVGNRIRRVSTGGIITTIAGDGTMGSPRFGVLATQTRLSTPGKIAVDDSGVVYVAAGYPQQLMKISLSGIIEAVTAPGDAHSGDGGPASKATFGLASGLATDVAGNVYLTDYSTHRVRKISTSGVITTVAGNGTNDYTGDSGPATSAAIGTPMDVTVDQAGNLYIAHQTLFQGGLRVAVRRVKPNGTINTVVGGGSEEPRDGLRATSAQFFGITDVATDIDGSLLFIDIAERIWRVTSGGILSRVAGDRASGYAGDGGLATAATLSLTRGLAVDRNGSIYVGAWQAVRKLTLVQSGCAFGVSPPFLSSFSNGGSFPFQIETSGACEWSVTNLPSWIDVSALSGRGSSTVTLTLGENTGPARTVTINVGGRPLIVTQQAADIGGCTYSLQSTGEIIGAAAASGSILLATGSGCGWTAISTVPWLTISVADTGSGSATVKYQASANDSGTSRRGTIIVGGRAFTVEQLSTHVGTLPSAGAVAHVVSGGGWKTTLTLVNSGTAPARTQLAFWGTTGSALALPVTFPQSGVGVMTASMIERTIAPGATLVVETDSTASDIQQGWAQIMSDGKIAGHAVLTQRVGDVEHEAAIPVDANSSANRFVLAFDQTNGRQTGVAIANVLAQYAEVTLTLFDDELGEIRDGDFSSWLRAPKQNIPPRGHVSFVLSTQFPITANRRGALEISVPNTGQVRAIGLQFNPDGGFFSIPVGIK